MRKKVAQAEYVAQRDVWRRWFKTLNISKPVNPNITFAGVIKSGLTLSSHEKAQPLVAVQGTSQQHELPELIKEEVDNTHNAHLKLEKHSRLVEKPVERCLSPTPVPQSGNTLASHL